jgi:hypothetical protein
MKRCAESHAPPKAVSLTFGAYEYAQRVKHAEQSETAFGGVSHINDHNFDFNRILMCDFARSS